MSKQSDGEKIMEVYFTL